MKFQLKPPRAGNGIELMPPNTAHGWSKSMEMPRGCHKENYQNSVESYDDSARPGTFGTF